MNTKIGIIGAGRWGTALAILLTKVGHHVKLFCLDEELSGLLESRQSRTLPSFSIPDVVEISSRVDDCLDRDFIFLAVPGANLKAAWDMWKVGIDKNAIVINAVKTIDVENRNLVLPSTIINRDGPHCVHFACVSFPEGLLRGSPTIGTAFAVNGHAAKMVVQLFSGTLIRPYISLDIVGGQIGSAIKNTIAIACGIAEGLGFDATTKAAIASRGLREMREFALHHMGHEETFGAGTTVLADLIGTCFGIFSHNHRYGLALANMSPEDAQKSVLGTIEGIQTTKVLSEVAESFQEKMPISFAVWSIISGTISPRKAIKQLMDRPVKLEG